MDDTPIPRPTWGYLLAAWAAALVFAAVAGFGVWFLLQQMWVGVASGAVVFVLAGFAAVAAAKREGRGNSEGAPPWTGDAGARHQNGRSI